MFCDSYKYKWCCKYYFIVKKTFSGTNM
jgi:hypothetical protein